MKKKAIVFTAIPVLIVFFASLFASKSPDALESVAISYGFDNKAKETTSFFTDYSLFFIKNEFLSTFIAGLIGLLLIFVLYKAINIAVKHFAK